MRTLRIALVMALLSATALLALVTPASAAGSVQVSGIGVPGAPGDGPCDHPDHLEADYAIAMTGDLEGCVYGYITLARYQESSGTYQEVADEVFVGSWGDASGSFEMTENFTAKYDPDTGDQIFGRCKHPIVAGSGTGDFTGATGRLDFKDDVAAGTAAYKGHIKRA